MDIFRTLGRDHSQSPPCFSGNANTSIHDLGEDDTARVGAGNKMIDLYVNLAMPFNSFLVVVIYILEIPGYYFGYAT